MEPWSRPSRSSLFLHVGYDVVLFGVDGHDAAVPAHLLEYLPQVPHGHPGVERRENLEAGDPRLDCFANLAHGAGRNGPGQDVVEGVVDVGMAPEGVPPCFDLGHYGVGGRDRAGREGQGPGKVHVGGDPTEGGGPAGRFRRLGKDAGIAAGPVVGHGHVDVGVGFDAAGQDDHIGGVDGLARAHIVQDARSGHRHDMLALDAHVHQANAIGSNYGPTLDNQVQHYCLPHCRFAMSHPAVPL